MIPTSSAFFFPERYRVLARHARHDTCRKLCERNGKFINVSYTRTCARTSGSAKYPLNRTHSVARCEPTICSSQINRPGFWASTLTQFRDRLDDSKRITRDKSRPLFPTMDSPTNSQSGSSIKRPRDFLAIAMLLRGSESGACEYALLSRFLAYHNVLCCYSRTPSNRISIRRNVRRNVSRATFH